MKSFIEKIITRFKPKSQINKTRKNEPVERPVVQAHTHTDKEPVEAHTYFKLARHWADDFYTQAVLERNRWRAITLYGCLPVLGVLLLCITLLIPAQHLEPILVNHYEDGQVSVQPLKRSSSLPNTQAEVESELVRYVVNRESYTANAYHEQYQLVNALSSNQVAKNYIEAQSASNKNSPINTLGEKGVRTVHVQSIVFLGNKERTQANAAAGTPHTLAEVNFTLTEHDNASGKEVTVPLMAVISWTYQGTPDDPDALWRNWDGFTVTSYTVQQRSL